MNSRGQLTALSIGHVVNTARAFDAVTGVPMNIQSGVGGGAAVQNEFFLFDEVGNMSQRQNGNALKTESFCYDSLYRLDHTTATGSCTDPATLQMGYDALGNIVSKVSTTNPAENVGSFTYHTTRKHAVISAGSNAYSYDFSAAGVGNGNMESRNGSAIQWTSFNYPSLINAGSKSTAFTYSPNRLRIQQDYNSNGTHEITQYVGGILEKVTVNGVTDWRHYVRVGNQLVAIISRQSTGTNTTRLVFTDPLGSLAQITDSAGASYVSESFCPFGARRDASTWSGSPTCGDLGKMKSVSREGFTGQDMIGGNSMGLVHFNGRVQDTITGRFLSADPFGVVPGLTQSWNRYSYVMNNPMRYTDPSGFDWSAGCIIDADGYVTNVGDDCYQIVDGGGGGDWFTDLLGSLFDSLFGGGGGPPPFDPKSIPATEAPVTANSQSAPCGASSAVPSANRPAGYADYLIASAGAQVSPFIVDGSYSNSFLWIPGTSTVSHYWSASTGPGLGLSAGGGVQVGTIGLNSPSDFTGFGIQSSGFAAWDTGAAATAIGGTGNLGLPGGATYSGATAGFVWGGGASIAAELSFTKFVGAIDFSQAPKNIRTALCKANGM
jgi:RHS repeat-associated protein